MNEDSPKKPLSDAILVGSTGAVPVCLPARWGASRFPGKLLQPLDGGTVLGRSVAIAQAAELGTVYVLAGDERMERGAQGLGATVRRVDGPWRNGSERIAAALRAGQVEAAGGLVVNLQADAVGAEPRLLRACLAALLSDPDAQLATVAIDADPAEHAGRTTVTVRDGRAVDFARSALPPGDGAAPGRLLLHVGVYAYRVPSLLRVAGMDRGPREEAASLEQLRWLENGLTVAVRVLAGEAELAHAIDRPGHLESRRSPQGGG